MKKVIFSVVAMLFALTACNQATQPASESAEPAVASTLTGRIAYVNIDSLVSGYDLAIDLQTAFETKAAKLDSDLASKSRSLERGLADYEEKITKGLVTRSQAAELEEKLTKQQNDFIAQRDAAVQQLSEEEAVMQNQIFFGISDYIKEYNKTAGYDMILTTSITGPILDANAELDITAVILKGINEKYAAEKSAN